jgi:hypothetical protein
MESRFWFPFLHPWLHRFLIHWLNEWKIINSSPYYGYLNVQQQTRHVGYDDLQIGRPPCFLQASATCWWWSLILARVPFFFFLKQWICWKLVTSAVTNLQWEFGNWEWGVILTSWLTIAHWDIENAVIVFRFWEFTAMINIMSTFS